MWDVICENAVGIGIYLLCPISRKKSGKPLKYGGFQVSYVDQFCPLKPAKRCILTNFWKCGFAMTVERHSNKANRQEANSHHSKQNNLRKDGIKL